MFRAGATWRDVTCHRTMATGKVFIIVIITGRKKVISPLRRIATRYDKTARMYFTGFMFLSIF
ncbi:hypothetical protein LPC_1559 [Legionella pneumophila str. Corby]|nr:hypothetical protein LPC_1559 [Legionella pneumophila str. Corby]